MILQLFVFLILGVKSSLAQTTSAYCMTGYEWTLNDLQQSPCLVAAFLGHQCAPNSTFNVPPLASGQEYLPPSGDQDNPCECSSVYFSLLSACSTCQGSSLGTFTSWTQACPESSVSQGSYPLTTPNGTHIPSWAYLQLYDGAFDVPAAGRNATGNPSFGKNPSTLSTGAIIGLAIGCTVAVLLIALVLFLYCRIRKLEGRRQPPLSVTHSRSGVRYDKIEGPPRRPWRFWPKATPKVVSYRAGLNFDLNKNRQGDLLELSDAYKGTGSQRASRESQPSTPFTSNTSIETVSRLPKKRENERATGETGFPNIFSRAKEVRPRGDARLDLAAEDRASPPSNHSSQFYTDRSPGREDRLPVLDM